MKYSSTCSPSCFLYFVRFTVIPNLVFLFTKCEVQRVYGDFTNYEDKGYQIWLFLFVKCKRSRTVNKPRNTVVNP